MSFHQTDFNKWYSTKIEFVHLKFCKHILGVNRSTSNILVRGEVGRIPLKTAVDTKIVQYYKHWINSENKLAHQALQLEREMHENQCYRLTNWLMFLCGQIQSPRPDVMPDRREGRGLCVCPYRNISQLVRRLLPD